MSRAPKNVKKSVPDWAIGPKWWPTIKDLDEKGGGHITIKVAVLASDVVRNVVKGDLGRAIQSMLWMGDIIAEEHDRLEAKKAIIDIRHGKDIEKRKSERQERWTNGICSKPDPIGNAPLGGAL